jgi:polyisoprenoid-binding protein YceI
MGFSTYVGQFTDVAATLDLNVGNPAASKLNASVRMDSVGTFSDGLDKHLKTADFFDTAKFPNASFHATGIRLVDRDTANISGSLTLRGVTKPVVIEADFNQAGVNPVDKQYSLGFDGKAKIKRSDFGINYGLPLLGDEVTLHLEAEFKRKAPQGGA